MIIETLVSTMNKKYNDNNLFKDMNLSGNVLVCNQSNTNNFYHTKHNNKYHNIYTYKEIGVGRSRNSLLLHSQADICILSDDDMVFYDNYEEIVTYEFEKRPEADILIFNIDDDDMRIKSKNDIKINYFNFTRYGAARIALRRKSIINNDIFFSLNFGGGTPFGSGEDSLFLKKCLDKKLKIIAINSTIAKLEDNRPSTWFEGYNDKYFKDKGALYYSMFPKTYLLRFFVFSYRNRNRNKKISFTQVLSNMFKGKSIIKNEIYRNNIKEK